MKHTTIIEGERLRLRPVREGDLPHWVKWFADPEVTKYIAAEMDVSEKVTLDVRREWFRAQEKNENEIVFSIELKRTGQHIGGADFRHIDERNRRASFDIVIGDTHEWGKGYCMDATRLMVEYGFKTLHLHRIYLSTDEKNSRAISCYERCGFTREALYREDALEPDGTYRSSVRMSILEHEWKKSKRKNV
jgi:RimJ/RimL family protein N-acetyltransferase